MGTLYVILSVITAGLIAGGVIAFILYESYESLWVCAFISLGINFVVYMILSGTKNYNEILSSILMFGPMIVALLISLIRAIKYIRSEISAQRKRIRDKRSKEQEEKTQTEIQRERLLQEQATQNRISNVREKIKSLNGYELNVVPFLYLLDKEGKRSEAFTQVADKYRDHAMKIKRDQERINREAESLGIPERARTAGR